MKRIGAFVDIDSLWTCNTCRNYKNNKCNTWCESGESYSPCHSKLDIVEGEITETAHWIISSDGYYPYCSNCKTEPKGGEMTKYCSECGCKMV